MNSKIHTYIFGSMLFALLVSLANPIIAESWSRIGETISQGDLVAAGAKLNKVEGKDFYHFDVDLESYKRCPVSAVTVRSFTDESDSVLSVPLEPDNGKYTFKVGKRYLKNISLVILCKGDFLDLVEVDFSK